MSIDPSNNHISFDLSKINLDKETGQRLAKLTKLIQENGKLEDKDVVWLGEALDGIQKMKHVDPNLEAVSQANSSISHDNILGKVKEYEKFIRSSEGQVAFAALEKQFSCYRALQSALHLDLIPEDKILHPNIKEVYQEKRAFMSEQVELSKISQILRQISRYPAMRQVLNKIVLMYEQWDEFCSNPEKVSKIQDNLKVLHKNLQIISDVLFNLKSSEQESLDQVLMQLDPKFFDKYIKNLKTMDESAVNELKEALRQEWEMFKKETPAPLSPKELKDKSEKAPVSPRSKRMQAGLFESSRLGTTWASKQSSLTESMGSSNLVFQLKDPKASREPTAFYKEGEGGEQATGIMEELMWQIAVKLGLESMFTPTKVARLRTKSNVSSPKTERIFSSETGDFIQKRGLSELRQGGIQPAIKGKPLESDHQISQEQVILGTLCVLIFGMSDAHADNILVDDNNNLHFFDNTRNMTHSNGVILYKHELVSALKSGLFVLEGTYKTFSKEERDFIQSQIKNVQMRVGLLEQYLKSSLVTKQLSNLPKGWFNVEEVLDAFKERIKNLDNAIRNPKVMNLRELIFETIPDLKFLGLLGVFMRSKEDPSMSFHECEVESLRMMGFFTLPELLKYAIAEGMDPQMFKEVSQSDLTFKEQLEAINTEVGKKCSKEEWHNSNKT